jgi:hypothetical protein
MDMLYENVIAGTSMHITFSKSLLLFFPMIFNEYPITKQKLIICNQFLQLKNVIYNWKVVLKITFQLQMLFLNYKIDCKWQFFF